jgi:integrase
MPRPRKPQWVTPGPGRPGRFRTVIDGKIHYFPTTIGRDDKPLIGGIPKAAWDHLHQLERRLEGDPLAASEPDVYWLCECFIQWCHDESQAGRLTRGQYLGHVAQLKLFTAHPEIAELKAALLDVDRMDEFFDALRRASNPKTGKHYSAHYVANVGKSIRAMLNWAARPVRGRSPARLLADNPLRGYRFPRGPGAVRGYVDPKYVRRFYRWAWARARRQPGLYRRFDRLFVLMLHFQRLTGCRPGEACGLEWGEIDWDGKLIELPPERFKTGLKRGQETSRRRKIHLTPPVERILRAIQRLPGHHDRYVFTHRRGNHAVDRGQGHAEAGEPWPSGSAASAKVRVWRREAIAERQAAEAAAKTAADEGRGEDAARLKALAESLKGIENEGRQKLVAYANRHAYVSDAVNFGLSHEQAANLVGNTAEVIRQVYAHAIDEADAERARRLVERGRKK